jgi:ketosteroid isomerase-like protein
MKPDVQALVDDWAGMFNSGQVEDLERFYAPDARIVPPGRPVLKGADEISGFFADIRSQGFRDYAVDISDTFEKDGALMASGRWSLTGPASGGVRQRYEGNWLNVLDQTPAGWRIVIHMWN